MEKRRKRGSFAWGKISFWKKWGVGKNMKFLDNIHPFTAFLQFYQNFFTNLPDIRVNHNIFNLNKNVKKRKMNLSPIRQMSRQGTSTRLLAPNHQLSSSRKMTSMASSRNLSTVDLPKVLITSIRPSVMNIYFCDCLS